MDFLSFARNSSNKYRKQLLDTGINASKKVIPKVVEATCEFLGNKITDAVAQSYNDRVVKIKPVEEIIIWTEKTSVKTSIIKWNSRFKLLNDLSVSKFVAKNRLKWFFKWPIFC